MFICVFTWFEDNEDAGELIEEQAFFGPFCSHKAAAEFGENKLQQDETDFGIGWSVATLKEPC